MKKAGIIILIVILLISSVGLGYLYYSKTNEVKSVKDKLKNTENKLTEANKKIKDLQKEEKEEEKTTACTAPIEGTYNGKYEEGNVHMEVTITLNKDKTYLQEVKNSEGQKGTYEIKDGKITFTHPQAYAPEGVADKTETYEISSDCQKIIVKNDTINYELTKQ